MDLTPREQVVLGAAQLRANQSINELAYRAGLPPHQVRRTLSSLEDRGIANPYTLVNQFKLGFGKCGIYFRATAGASDKVQECISKLVDLDSVVSVVELFGHYHYFISIAYRDMQDLQAELSGVEEAIGDVLGERAISLRIALCLFQRRYLWDQSSEEGELYYAVSGGTCSIDSIDRAIINELRQDGVPTARELARRIKCSPSTASERLRSLTERGVIVGYAYSVQPETFGFQASDLLLSCTGATSNMFDELRTFCRREKFAIGLTKCIGPWDFEIRIEVPSANEAVSFEQRVLSRFRERIQSIETVNISREIKYMKTPVLLE